MEIKLKSSAFEEGGDIPEKYTADGENISPPLEWSGVPDGTRSLALVSEDPDAPGGMWVHWVLFNLPADLSRLPENIPPQEKLDNRAVHGKTDFGSLGYGGPAPPSGTHRYFFKIYALDCNLDLPAGATKEDLVKTMETHVLGQGQLVGKYSR